jgi:adenine deaminase
VFLEGRLAAADGVTSWPRLESLTPNRFDARPKQPGDFAIATTAAGPQATVRVIEALDGQLVTGSLRLPMPVAGGRLLADPARDILKIAVIDRYDDRPPAVGFIKNIGLRHGAIASSVSHDSHNIVAVGADDDSLARAVNLVIESRGGLAVTGPEGDAVLPLPIAGLMSDRPGPDVAKAYADLDRRAKAAGATLTAPFMTLAFMALLVIPSLKIGPDGLFDVDAFHPVGLID